MKNWCKTCKNCYWQKDCDNTNPENEEEDCECYCPIEDMDDDDFIETERLEFNEEFWEVLDEEQTYI